MTDKMEALTQIMENIDHLEKLRDMHKNIAENPTTLPLKEIVETCETTAAYLSLQIDMLRDMLGDKSIFYATFNALNYVTEE